MADNIIIKITTEADLDAAQKQIQDLTNKIKDQEKAMAKLTRQEKEDAEALKNSIADRDRLSKALEENARYYEEERNAKKDDISATKGSIKELEKQIKSYKTLHGQSGKMVQQLRAMREELQRMEDAGEFGTEAFMELAVAAGKLEDQIGDTQARIRVLSSDTIGLDTAMGIGDGLAGAFYVATSAAEVFGQDMEALQMAFYKVQAAMSTLSGVQQVANALNKDSVVSVVLGTKMEGIRQKALAKSAAAEAAYTAAKAGGVAADGAKVVSANLLTKAQWKLNAAIAANPLGAIVAIILAAVAAAALLFVGISKLIDVFTGAAAAQKDYKEASRELEKVQKENALGQEIRALEQEERMQKLSEMQDEELAKAEERNASEIEMAMLKAKQAEETYNATKEYNDKLKQDQQEEIALLERMMLAKEKEAAAYKDGGKKQKKAQEELIEVQAQYAEAVRKSNDLDAQTTELYKAQQQAAKDLAAVKKSLQLEIQQNTISLMGGGMKQEIAQIEFDFEQKKLAYQGGTEEEIKILSQLEKLKEQQIKAVRQRYGEQYKQERERKQQEKLDRERQDKEAEQQLEQIALEKIISTTEEEYAKRIELQKQLATEEAEMRKGFLDKKKLGETAYAAEVEQIELDLANKLKEINDQYTTYLNENTKRNTELRLMEAEAATNILNQNDSLEKQKATWQDFYNTRKDQINENLAFEIEAINKSAATEEVKNAKIQQLTLQANAELLAIEKEQKEKLLDLDYQYIDGLQRNLDAATREAEAAQGKEKYAALEKRFNAEQELYSAQENQLKAQYDAGIIEYQDYENERWEITKATEDSIAAYRQEKMAYTLELLNTSLNTMQQISDLAFEAIANNIQAELDALDEMYTTDAEEAKKNANKKYITEEEYAKKKAALEQKQAKYNKAQALINAAINTALAVTSALTAMPPMSFIMAGIAAAMGAAQIGIIASKPLAQYAKGRKGGKGEYALVGEKGPELMYVPQGASIVPNHHLGDMAAWEKFGVPALPNDMMSAAMLQQINIDYDRLGKAVAANIPQQKAVSVNVDRRGVTISENGNRRTYLNHKYTGAWS